jgi:hypothetical protein
MVELNQLPGALKLLVNVDSGPVTVTVGLVTVATRVNVEMILRVMSTSPQVTPLSVGTISGRSAWRQSKGRTA